MYSRQKVHSQVSRMFADEYLLFIPPAIPCSLIFGDDWTILSGLWRLKFAAPLPWPGFNLLRLLMAGAPEPGRSPLIPHIPHIPQIPRAGCDLRKLVYSA